MAGVGDAVDSTMTLHGHIREARRRLFVVALAFIVFSSLAYVFRDEIIYILLQPLQGQKLSYLTPGGGFSFIFKVSMWVGIAASFPVAIYSIYKFVSPTLPKKVRRYSAILLVCSSLLMIAGAVFGYFFAIPGAMRFLLTFADNYVNAMLTADSYLSFVLAYTLGLGIIFQIPLILLIIHWIKPLKPKQLLNFERYVIVVAFIIAAVITPTPDPTNQFIMAMPMIALYQAGVATVGVSIWQEKRALRKEARRNRKRPVAQASTETREEPEFIADDLVSIPAPQPAQIFQEEMVETAPSSGVKRRRQTQFIDGFRASASSQPVRNRQALRQPQRQASPHVPQRSSSLQPALRRARPVDGISRVKPLSPMKFNTSR